MREHLIDVNIVDRQKIAVARRVAIRRKADHGIVRISVRQPPIRNKQLGRIRLPLTPRRIGPKNAMNDIRAILRKEDDLIATTTELEIQLIVPFLTMVIGEELQKTESPKPRIRQRRFIRARRADRGTVAEHQARKRHGARLGIINLEPVRLRIPRRHPFIDAQAIAVPKRHLSVLPSRRSRAQNPCTHIRRAVRHAPKGPIRHLKSEIHRVAPAVRRTQKPQEFAILAQVEPRVQRLIRLAITDHQQVSARRDHRVRGKNVSFGRSGKLRGIDAQLPGRDVHRHGVCVVQLHIIRIIPVVVERGLIIRANLIEQHLRGGAKTEQRYGKAGNSPPNTKASIHVAKLITPTYYIRPKKPTAFLQELGV